MALGVCFAPPELEAACARARMRVAQPSGVPATTLGLSGSRHRSGPGLWERRPLSAFRSAVSGARPQAAVPRLRGTRARCSEEHLRLRIAAGPRRGRWRWGAAAEADEASSSGPPLPSCGAAWFPAGHGPVPVRGPGVGDPCPEGSEKPESPHEALTLTVQLDLTKHAWELWRAAWGREHTFSGYRSGIASATWAISA